MNKPCKKIFLWGYYGAKNVGDDLLLSTLLDTLLAYKNTKITVIVAKKYKNYNAFKNVDFVTPLNEPSQRFFILKNIVFYIKMIRDNDLTIFGGGTSLFETANTKYKSLLVKYIILLCNHLFFKRPVIHLGVGIGEVNTAIGKFCLKNILNFSNAINLREKKSYDKAFSLIKNKNKISLGNDLAYLTPFTLKEVNTSANIGISLFQYYGYISDDTSKIDVFYNKCKSLIEKILNMSPNIQIHLFSLQKEKGGKDEEFNLKLKTEITSPKLHLYPYNSDTTEFVDNIISMDLCIGMRLHFLILSILHGIPIVGLSYQPKVRNELVSLNLEKFCLEMNEFDQILSFIKEFIENKQNFYSKYTCAFNQVEIKNKQTSNILHNILSSYLQ